MSRKVMFTKPAFNVPYMLRKAYLQSSLSTPYILFRAWTLDHINYTLRRACNKGLYIIRFVGLGGLERFTPASSKRVNMAYFTLPAGVKTFHALKKGDGFGGVYNIRGNPMAQRRCSSENNYRLVRENRTQHFIILQQVPIPLKDLTEKCWLEYPVTKEQANLLISPWLILLGPWSIVSLFILPTLMMVSLISLSSYPLSRNLTFRIWACCFHASTGDGCPLMGHV